MSRVAPPLVVSVDQHAELERLARSQTEPHRVVVRAKALLMAARGEPHTVVAEQFAVSVATVRSWRNTFEAKGLDKFARVASGRGRKVSISQDKVVQIVFATRFTKPEGKTHWSCRDMAKAQGVSPATVQRIWSGHGLKPHLVTTFKLSNDKRFEEKLVDVVGLYLNPPEGALNRP